MRRFKGAKKVFWQDSECDDWMDELERMGCNTAAPGSGAFLFGDVCFGDTDTLVCNLKKLAKQLGYTYRGSIGCEDTPIYVWQKGSICIVTDIDPDSVTCS